MEMKLKRRFNDNPASLIPGKASNSTLAFSDRVRVDEFGLAGNPSVGKVP